MNTLLEEGMTQIQSGKAWLESERAGGDSKRRGEKREWGEKERETCSPVS